MGSVNKTAGQWRPIGPMVELLAKGHNLTLGEIADYLGIHRNSMTEKIHGRRAFTEVEIAALAALFGVPAGRLFEDPLELLGVSPELSGRRPSAGSGSSLRRSGWFADQFALAA